MIRINIRWGRVVAAAGAVLLAIQAVPYGRDHTNPPVVQEPQWDTPATRALAERACFDCHSNETKWPAYSNVAPVSWLVLRDVQEGREKLNLSEWQRPQKEAGEVAEVLTEGEMPMWIYTVMHSHARLTDAERTALARGLEASFRAAPAGGVATAR